MDWNLVLGALWEKGGLRFGVSGWQDLGTQGNYLAGGSGTLHARLRV